ncbi:MAG: alpha/beta hydrolase [Aphanothece sp. CMT-3BRIN-NPC111]|jgi:pimeloyl-ACP methyl ester carboxylesterase|nr:alpha/beta hydrolase [Aphanothece sp. CMT-3BRIN-NPC111]
MALPISNSRIRLPQGQIFWREVGQGPTLVFLHGSWSDSSQWISVVNRLSKDYHCFAPDLLGFGDSECPQVNYSIELEVECLAEFLETLNQRQVYLIGHSLGGWIAASYALKYPDLVSGLVLLAPEGLSDQKVRKHGWWTRFLLGRSSLLFWLLRSLQSLASLLGQQEKFKRTSEYWQQRLKSPTACQLLWQRDKSEIEAELLQEKLEWLKVPVLILQGGQDAPTAIATSKTYANLTPAAKYHIIDKGGNNLPQEFPQQVAQCISDFINSYEL